MLHALYELLNRATDNPRNDGYLFRQKINENALGKHVSRFAFLKLTTTQQNTKITDT